MKWPYMLLALLLVISGVPIPSGARAQQGAENDEEAVLEEIVVTARKREEALQNVPISISVVSGETLQESNIRNLEQMSALVPTFQYSEAVSGNDQVFIRGVGSGVNFGFENSVGQVFDGFFFGRARFGRASFMDVQQIEILKGPQGAIVGKNTTGGVINTRWAHPTEAFEGYLIPAWEFDGDEGFVVQGAASGPLSETVRARLAFRYDNKQGYTKNVTLNDKVMRLKSPSFRAMLDWLPTETLSASLVFQYNNQNRVGRTTELTFCPPALAAQLAPFGEDCTLNYRTTGSVVQNGQRLKQTTDTEAYFVGLTINWDTPIGTVSSLTGFARFTTADFGGSSIAGQESNVSQFHETYEQWTQEVRLASTEDRVIDYLAGFYWQSVPKQNLDLIIDFNAQGPPPFAFFPPLGRVRDNRLARQDSQTAAGFGEVTWNITDQWHLTAGLRFTHEEKSIRHQKFITELFTDIPRPPSPLPIPPVHNVHDVSDRITENQWSPSGSVRWQPTDEATFYATVATGFKGGGFDFFLVDPQETALANIRFGREQATSYEIGGKFRVPSNRLRMNIALFRSKVKDLQVTTLTFVPEINQTLFKTANAGSAITQGVEADFRWRPLDNLSINGSGALLDAEYDKYPNAPCYTGQTVEQGCAPNEFGRFVQDLSGKTLQFAPNWKFALSGQYTVWLRDDLSLRFFTRVTYSDRFALQLDLDPRDFQGSYAKIDATITLVGNDGGWQIALIGRNLTDKLTKNFGNDAAAGSHFFFVQPPRSLTLQARINFGAAGK